MDEVLGSPGPWFITGAEGQLGEERGPGAEVGQRSAAPPDARKCKGTESRASGGNEPSMT